MSAASGPGWVDQVKAWPVADIANRFGFDVLRRGADASFRCPVCGKNKRHTKIADNRLAAKIMPENRWWCEPCGACGDGLALACAVVTGAPTATRERWRDVRAACVACGLCMPDAFSTDPSPTMTFRPPVVTPAPSDVARAHPPTDEVESFWNSCEEVTATSPPGTYLASRGFSLARLPWLHMVRAAPSKPTRSFEWYPDSWLQGWPLIFQMVNARGELRSLQGRAISSNIEPKTRLPYQFSASGLLFADGMGLESLRSHGKVGATRGLEGIFLAEGATDALKLAQVLEGTTATMGVLGYVAGSKHALAHIDWPHGVPCIVATDNDAVGDKYAAEVRRALHWRVTVYRVKAPQGRDATGAKVGDWSDLTDAQVLETVVDATKWQVCHG